ncbi:TetR/AcrR family transcriptional regulator [Oryzibacter oryziterrae]|uniref:TetR/AcrR family transcriptional regulator n=1 Tax=Oryzibacter oryziterrae TaxID=2766474 RepID=UPI001F16AB04|nr:hypothetical protein [Oryzibacter oryziterrae]
MESLSAKTERLLDVAETLFADLGIEGVSDHVIAHHAGLNPDDVAQCYSSKHHLLDAVIARRLGIINVRRREVLSALSSRIPAASVKDLMSAFIRPYVELATLGDDGWVSYARLMAQFCQSDRRSHLVELYLDEARKLFVEAMSRAYPKADPATLRQGFRYTLVLLASCYSGVGRIDELISGRLDARHLDVIVEPLITFATAGMVALCAPAAA